VEGVLAICLPNSNKVLADQENVRVLTYCCVILITICLLCDMTYENEIGMEVLYVSSTKESPQKILCQSKFNSIHKKKKKNVVSVPNHHWLSISPNSL
jgi:hypothetical protein